MVRKYKIKSIDERKTIFQLREDDVSDINLSSVNCRLKPPTVSGTENRLLYKFDKPIDVKEQ